MANMFYDPPSS